MIAVRLITYTILVFVVLFCISSCCSAEQFKKYPDAALDSKKTGKPLVIVLSGDFCPWCTKQKIELEKSKVKDFNWVVVNIKKYPMYSVKGGIPQLCIIVKVDGRWVKKTYVGYKDTKKIRELITWQKNKT
tara:strand:+ start:63 stop:455 length:393 start_codon:yes stop_codon:yes gene_type:complete